MSLLAHKISQLPLVSVLMTAFNREAYITEAIESVLRSTYTNFELIVVDDCSTDCSVTIAKAFEEKDPRVRVYVNESNLGDYKNRNRAASFARGKYLKFLDSDDMIYSHGLDVMVKSMEKFPAAALGMTWGLQTAEPLPVLINSYDAYHTFFFENKGMYVGPSGSIYRRDAFEQVGGFSGRPCIGDFELNLKLAARFPVVRLHPGLFFYREHNVRQSTDQDNVMRYYYLTHRVMVEALMDNNCPLSKTEITDAFKTINKLQARRSVYVFLKKKKFAYLKLLVTESKLGWANFVQGILTP